MTEPLEHKPKHTLRNLWLGFGAVVLLLLAYTGFVFWSRSEDTKLVAQRQAEMRAAEQREADEKSVDALGGSDFKILAFYASPGRIHRGDQVTLCYGVSNAKSVKLDPPDGSLWPAATRCLQIAPKKTTKYTLTADDGAGNTKSADLTITVK
jgi:hypothetical protein